MSYIHTEFKHITTIYLFLQLFYLIWNKEMHYTAMPTSGLFSWDILINYICSTLYYGNINKDYHGNYHISVPFSLLVIIYYTFVLGVSSCFCHTGATCEWLLDIIIPTVSSHYLHQTWIDTYVYVYMYMYMYMHICIYVYMNSSFPKCNNSHSKECV